MKTHSQKKWVFRFSSGGYLGMDDYIRSNFQNWKFVHLIADSKSLEKTIKRKYLSFFEILIGT